MRFFRPPNVFSRSDDDTYRRFQAAERELLSDQDPNQARPPSKKSFWSNVFGCVTGLLMIAIGLMLFLPFLPPVGGHPATRSEQAERARRLELIEQAEVQSQLTLSGTADERR